MGTWGAGNFDNDGALDYVGEVEHELVRRIEEILADEDRRALDEEGESVLLPTVEMLSVLHEHCRFGLPQLETVRRWKVRYLATFDEQIESLGPRPGFAEARRGVIEASFLKLEAQAWDAEKRNQWFAPKEE